MLQGWVCGVLQYEVYLKGLILTADIVEGKLGRSDRDHLIIGAMDEQQREGDFMDPLLDPVNGIKDGCHPPKPHWAMVD